MKDLKPATVSVTVFYRFSKNGGFFTHSLSGKFNVHRPTTSQASPYQPHGTPTAMIVGQALSLGDQGDPPIGDMSFAHTINPGTFSGSAGYIQVISSLDIVPWPPGLDPFNGPALDTAEYPRGTHNIPASANTSVLFWDGPQVGLNPRLAPTKESAAFSTHLMFKPDGGPGPNIFVPLRSIQWELHDEATHEVGGWTARTSNEHGATGITGNDPGTEFPYWVTIFP